MALLEESEVTQVVADHRFAPEAIRVEMVENIQAWRDALHVLDATYRDEQGWIAGPAEECPMSDLSDPEVAWFLARHDGQAVGVVRVLFKIPMERHESCGYSQLRGGLALNELVRGNRVAEVGRLAVVPRWRGTLLVPAQLMRAAATEAVRRGYDHFVTDVFENEPSSSLQFHRHILGFRVVATHEHAERELRGKRMTMHLDLKDAYERLRKRRGWVFRLIVESWSPELHAKLTA